MARKVIGMARNVTSWRMRWLLSLVVLAGAGLTFVTVLQAVHRDGVFELDGNVASTSDALLNCATIPADLGCGIDWENVAKGTLPAGVSSTGIIADPPLEKGGDQSIFTTGGSKDDLDTTNWQWTTGSVPDKDEVLDAYAARIGNNVYFGADRFITNGTAQMGFWFFQNNVGPQPDGTFGTAGHKVGDVLVLADFTNGGSAVTVQIYKWVGTGGDTNGTLQLILPLPDPMGGDPDPADCRDATLGSGDDFCGTTNPAPIDLVLGQTPASTTPLWPYQAKSGPANLIPVGGFLEGGIDLTALGLGDQCFASFLAETRSSAEPGAQLKDFVSHTFEPCESGLVTTPQSQTAAGPTFTDIPAAGVGIGAGSVTVRDKAVVNVTGVQTWAGNVTFFLCGPTPLADPYAVCTSGGVQVGGAIAVSAPSPATVFSAATTVTSVGKYCWRGEFTATTQGVPPATDATAGECFTVNPVPTGLITNATAGPVPLGTPIDDVASLSLTANKPGSPVIGGPLGAPAGGTITFTLYGPSPTPNCSTTPIATSVVNVSGNGNYSASSGTITGTLTPTQAGTYYWVAVYSGDPPNTLGSSGKCGDSNEQTIVSPNQPTLVTVASAPPPGGTPLGNPISDTATLSGTAAPSNGVFGTITFIAYGPHANTTTCTTQAYTSTVTVNGNGNFNSATGTGGVFTPTLPGNYNWRASYTPGAGDVNNLPVALTPCGAANEGSLVNPLTPQVATSQFLYPNDSATVRVVSGGGNLAGTVRFRVWVNDATCAGTPIVDQTRNIVADGTGTGIERSVATTNWPGNGLITAASIAGDVTIRWRVDYVSTNTGHNSVPGTCGMESTVIDVTDLAFP